MPIHVSRSSNKVYMLYKHTLIYVVVNHFLHEKRTPKGHTPNKRTNKYINLISSQVYGPYPFVCEDIHYL